MNSTFCNQNARPETPATAGTHLMVSGPKLCAVAQSQYQGGVGKLLYLVKWSYLEIANSVQELTWLMTETFLS